MIKFLVLNKLNKILNIYLKNGLQIVKNIIKHLQNHGLKKLSNKKTTTYLEKH